MLGKIISINKTTKEYEVLSIGHRNQQGLYYHSELDLIINTEHGPEGGDEVNINSELVSNFGWDISSYGTDYFDSSNIYKKSHKDYGFNEPFINFTPSIGISEIDYYKNKKNEKNYFFISSLRARSIYVVEIDENIKQKINQDRIKFKRRIRDIKLDLDNNNLFLLFDDIPSLGVLKIDY